MTQSTQAGPWPIPNGWEWVRASDVAAVVGGGTPSTADPRNFHAGTIPWITPADLSGYSQKSIACGARSITQRGFESSGAQLIPAGSVLLSTRAPIGYVAIAACQLTTNQGFKTFVLKPVLTPDFVYHYLHRAKDLEVSLASGTTFLELSKRKAETLPMPVPPIAEQRRIVEAIETRFARLDAAVRALERARANLKRYRASVIRVAARGDLTPHESEWRPVGLFEVADDLDGKRVPVNWRDREKRAGDVPYYGATGQVGWIDGYLFDEELVLLGEDGVDFLNPLKPKAYSVHGKSWVNNHAHVLRAKPGVMMARFLEIQLNAHNYFGLANGTTRLKLTKSAMRKIRVALPSIKEQVALAAEVDRRLSVAEETAVEVEHGLRRGGRLRDSILKIAFEGRLVTQDPRDEPASALLERIMSTSENTPKLVRNAKGVLAAK